MIAIIRLKKDGRRFEVHRSVELPGGGGLNTCGPGIYENTTCVFFNKSCGDMYEICKNGFYFEDTEGK
jgi:hypothetical protein